MRAKRHHQVPVFYLRAFANSKEQVAVQDRTKSAPYYAGIRQVAVENNLYTVETSSGDASDELEREFSEREASFAAAWHAFSEDSQKLSEEDRWLISEMVAFQYIRTNLQRERMSNIKETALRQLIGTTETSHEPSCEEALNERLRDLNLHPSVAKQALSLHQDPSTSIDLPAEEWLGHRTEWIHAISEIVFAKKWYVFETRKRGFLTSDNPVCLCKSGVTAFSGVGFETADEILVPINPRKCLVLTPTTHDRSVELIQIHESDATQFRRVLMHNCVRQVIAHPMDTHFFGQNEPMAERVILATNQRLVTFGDRKRGHAPVG